MTGTITKCQLAPWGAWCFTGTVTTTVTTTVWVIRSVHHDTADGWADALAAAAEPIRQFMYKQTQKNDVNFFMDISRTEWNGELADIPMSVLVPAFIINELRQAFIIGFLIYIPFIVIDMVVASTLMSMGMMMLPPTTISMPFKILLFVLADGWYLVIKGVVESFNF